MKQPEDQYHIERSSEAVIETRTRQVRSIKNLPVENSTREDENFIKNNQEIIKR